MLKKLMTLQCDAFLNELKNVSFEKFDTVHRGYMLSGKAKAYNLNHIGRYHKPLLLEANKIEQAILLHPELSEHIVKERALSVSDPSFSPNMKNLMVIDAIGIRVNVMLQGHIIMKGSSNDIILEPNNCYLIDTQGGVTVRVLSYSMQLNLQLIPKDCKLHSWELLRRVKAINTELGE